MAFKSVHYRAWAQECADLTSQRTSMYLDDGVVRLVMEGWPMRGKLIMVVEPRRTNGT